MKDSIEKRIALVKEADNPEELKKCLCSFFEKGGCPECVSCRKTEADLEECRDYYLERIGMIPKDIWDEDFDKVLVRERETVVPVDSIVGIGSVCDNCYMYDKCPLYKKGYACGIKWDADRPKTPTEFMDFLISTQYERVKRSYVFEKIDGGVPDAGLSSEIDRLHGLVASKADMGRDRLSINVEATGSATPSSGGGILAKLFGSGGASTPLPESKPTIELPEKPMSREGVTELAEFEEIKEVKKPVRQRKKG